MLFPKICCETLKPLYDNENVKTGYRNHIFEDWQKQFVISKAF